MELQVLDSQGRPIRAGVAYLWSSGGEGSEPSVVIIESVNGSGTVDGWALEFERALNDIPPDELSRPLSATWEAWPELKKAVIDYAGVDALDLT